MNVIEFARIRWNMKRNGMLWETNCGQPGHSGTFRSLEETVASLAEHFRLCETCRDQFATLSE